MNTIADRFEVNLNQDGQVYGVVFDGHIDDSPRRCEIFVSGCKIGEATWHKDDGLLDRFPENDTYPPKFWNELCDQIEMGYGFMLRGVASARKNPWFVTEDGKKVHFQQSDNGFAWVGDSVIYEARVVTGSAVKDSKTVEGTFFTKEPTA